MLCWSKQQSMVRNLNESIVFSLDGPVYGWRLFSSDNASWSAFILAYYPTIGILDSFISYGKIINIMVRLHWIILCAVLLRFFFFKELLCNFWREQYYKILLHHHQTFHFRQEIHCWGFSGWVIFKKLLVWNFSLCHCILFSETVNKLWIRNFRSACM